MLQLDSPEMLHTGPLTSKEKMFPPLISVKWLCVFWEAVHWVVLAQTGTKASFIARPSLCACVCEWDCSHKFMKSCLFVCQCVPLHLNASLRTHTSTADCVDTHKNPVTLPYVRACVQRNSSVHACISPACTCPPPSPFLWKSNSAAAASLHIPPVLTSFNQLCA